MSDSPPDEIGMFPLKTPSSYKLQPPNLRQVLPRPRLLTEAALAPGQIIVIEAGAGFGKTTLMAQLAQIRPGNSVWYQIDSFDNDPMIFLRNLIGGISCVCPEVLVRSKSYLTEAVNLGIEWTRMLTEMLEELNEHLKEPLTLCFDDYHLLDVPNIASQFVSLLIARLPHQASLIIASRTKPNFQLARMRSQGRLCEIGEIDLKFSLFELQELLSKWEIGLEETVIEDLHQSTDGWAAGLVLAEGQLRSGNTAVPNLFLQQRLRQNVYEYLAEEVLQQQSQKMQSFLLSTSLIDPIDPIICKAIGIVDADILLQHACRRNLFTVKMGETPSYRYHPLFRDFLISRLFEEQETSEIKRFRLKIAQAYLSQNQKKEAIEQFLQADSFREAVELLDESCLQMMKAGEYETVNRWLRIVREQDLTDVLVVCQGLIVLATCDASAALDALKSSRKRINHEDCDLVCECTMAIATCLGYLRQFDDAIIELKSLLALKLSSSRRMEVLIELSRYYGTNFDIKEFMRWLKEAKHLACKEQDASSLLKINFMLSAQLLRRGDFKRANQFLCEALKSNALSANQRSMAMNNLASSLVMLGEYDEALTKADECLELVKQQNESRWMLIARDTFACALLGGGNYVEANKHLERVILEADSGTENAWIKATSCCHLGTSARWRGDLDVAWKYHSECVEISRSFEEKYELATGLVNQGADLLRLHRIQSAESCLGEAYELAIQHDFGYLLTMVDFHRAWAAYLLQDESSLLLHLQQAFARAREYQQNHFIIQEGKISLPLFVTALAHDIELEYSCWVLTRIGTAALSVLGQFATSESAQLRFEVIKAIGNIGDPAAIALLRRGARDADVLVQKASRRALTHLRSRIKAPIELLTTREDQIMKLMAEGASNKQIAAQLFIAESTVKTHVSRIFKKLGLSSRLEVALFFQESTKNTTF